LARVYNNPAALNDIERRAIFIACKEIKGHSSSDMTSG